MQLSNLYYKVVTTLAECLRLLPLTNAPFFEFSLCETGNYKPYN